MPQNPTSWWGQPSSPTSIILSSAAADPTDGAFLETEILSFLPNFMMLFASSSSAASFGTAQKIVNKTEI